MFSAVARFHVNKTGSALTSANARTAGRAETIRAGQPCSEPFSAVGSDPLLPICSPVLRVTTDMDSPSPWIAALVRAGRGRFDGRAAQGPPSADVYRPRCLISSCIRPSSTSTTNCSRRASRASHGHEEGHRQRGAALCRPTRARARSRSTTRSSSAALDLADPEVMRGARREHPLPRRHLRLHRRGQVTPGRGTAAPTRHRRALATFVTVHLEMRYSARNSREHQASPVSVPSSSSFPASTRSPFAPAKSRLYALRSQHRAARHGPPYRSRRRTLRRHPCTLRRRFRPHRYSHCSTGRMDHPARLRIVAPPLASPW